MTPQNIFAENWKTKKKLHFLITWLPFCFFFGFVFWDFPWMSHGSIFHEFSMEAGGRQKMWGGVGGGGSPPDEEANVPKARR